MMLDEIEIKPIFPELYIDYCNLSNEFFLLYPLPAREYYVFITKLLDIFKNSDKNKDFLTDCIDKIDKIRKLLIDIYHDENFINDLNEDDVIKLLFTTIHINIITLPTNKKEEDKKELSSFTVNDFIDSINNFISMLNMLFKIYIKLNIHIKGIGDISTPPQLFCSFTNLPCSLCNKFDFKSGSCKYSYIKFNYLTIGGLSVVCSLCQYSKLEDKDFLHRILTGESLIDKITLEKVKGKEIEKDESVFSENEREEIYNEVKNIIYNKTKNFSFKFKNISSLFNSFEEKVKNQKITPEDVSLKSLIEIMCSERKHLCPILNYILYIRKEGYVYDFPYDCEYSIRLVNEEHTNTLKAFGNEVSDEIRLSRPRVWDDIRYNTFMEAFNKDDIVRMRISYVDWFWNWYWFILRKEYDIKIDEITLEDIYLKYIYDEIIFNFAFAYNYDIIIFDNKEKFEKLKNILNEFILCVKNLRKQTKIIKYFNDIFDNPLIDKNIKLYYFDIEKYKKENKIEDSKGNLVISSKYIITEIDKYSKYLEEIKI